MYTTFDDLKSLLYYLSYNEAHIFLKIVIEVRTSWMPAANFKRNIHLTEVMS